MLILITLLVLSVQKIFATITGQAYDLDELTNNLIENLRADPFLSVDLELSNNSKTFIDKQIGNYMFLKEKSEEKELSRLKRSLPPNKREADDYSVDLKPYLNIASTETKDAVFFKQNFTWYAISLENESNGSYANILSIKKYKKKTFTPTVSIKVLNGVAIAAFPMRSTTIIVLVENKTIFTDFDHQTSVFEFSQDEQLELMQNINSSYSSQVAIWRNSHNIFMTVVQMARKDPQGISYRVENPIYKWYGRHFDIIQHITTYGATRMFPFSVEDVHFLANANSQIDEGLEKVYSEILKYNVHTEKYELFQKILTHGCKDIKYFEIGAYGEVEHFLIVANFGDQDKLGNLNYNISSIIYKFIDNYFIPFQSIQLRGVTELQPVTAGNREIVIFASTLDGIKSFRYDGWHFTESTTKFPTYFDSRTHVRAMHYYNFEGRDVLAVINLNEKPSTAKLFEISFSSRNDLSREHDQLLSWCLDSSKNLKILEDSDVLGNSIRGDISEEIDSASQQGSTDIEKLQIYKSALYRIENKIKHSLHSEDIHRIDYNLTSKSIIILNSTGMLKFVDVDNINAIKINNLLEKKLNINDGFEVNAELTFDLLRLEEPISPRKINNFSAVDMLFLTDLFNASKLHVKGNVIFKNNVTVKNKINNFTVDHQNLLLYNEDQSLGNFSVKSLHVNDLETSTLNDFPVKSIKDVNKNTDNIKKLQLLKARHVVVGGFMNDLDIATLFKYALRKFEEQNITGAYYFDNIKADNMDTNTLSGKQIKGTLVQINQGKNYINKDVMFTVDFFANNLTAIKYLDSIAIKNGKLDLLLKDSTERQDVSGVKTFENLELLNPIKLQGKIRGKFFETMNPFIKIDTDLKMKGDIRITGDVTAEDIIKVHDIVTSDGRNSLSRMQHLGLKLTDAEIPTRMEFSQHINVAEVIADRINNVNPSSWVVNGAERTQIVYGRKQFRGDLEITGNTDVFLINGIDTEELEKDVLRKNGDQVIRGKHYVQYVAAEKRIISNNTKFGPQPWQDVITTTGDQVISGTTLFSGNFTLELASASNVNVNGLINDLNLTKIVYDAATKDTVFTIFGNKTLKNITIENLYLKNFDLDHHLDNLDDHNLNVHTLDHLESISVKIIHFDNTINGLDKNDFENTNTDGNLTLSIETDVEFEKITVFGNVYVASNYINNVDLTDFENNTVKLDEPFYFDSVTFKNGVIVADKLNLNGHVDGFDLDNIFQNGVNDTQIIKDAKTFEENVTVTGPVYINGVLNGVNVSKLCDFGKPTRGTKHLVLEGNSHFVKGPNVHNFNGLKVKELGKQIWFKDKQTVLNGNIEFKNDVEFKEDIQVTSLLNDINLKHLSRNYFSKSKDQKLPANMNFLDGIVFEDDVATPELLIDGQINGINLKKFISDVLLHRPQLFEDQVYFENVAVENVDGDYLLNKLNLERDLMRYDKPNIITGPKVFENLQIGTLRFDRNIAIQDVNVSYWLENAVLNNGSFSISGRKTFTNATLQKSLSLMGFLNDIKIDKDYVLLSNVPQNITGRKLFILDSPEEINFKALKVKGMVNAADIGEIVHYQAHKSKENIINATTNFHNKISTKNVNFEKCYQGLNVSELLMNVTKLESLNSFKESYNNLMTMSAEVETALENKVNFLSYFKLIDYPPKTNFIVSSTRRERKYEIMTFTNENGSTILEFMEWNREYEIFQNTEGYSIGLGAFPEFIEKVTLGSVDYIYIEQEVDEPNSEDHSHTGKLIHFRNTTFDYQSFLTKGTSFLTSFELEAINSSCLLFIDFMYDVNIICAAPTEEFHLHQTIKFENAHMASVLNIEGSLYLITIRKKREKHESRTAIWKFNDVSSMFEIQQTIYEGEPISVTTVNSRHGHYLAVAYGYQEDTKDYGKIAIRRFDVKHNEFALWQNIHLKTPTQIEFAVLPSEELVLYVLTENPTERFNAYIYRGISGFNKKIGSSLIQNIIRMNQFSLNNEHFIVVQHYDEISIIQALIKGGK